MTIDWTISLGNILTIVGFAGSGIIFVMMMRGDIRLLSQGQQILANRIAAVEIAMRDVAKSQLLLAEQKGEMDAMRERVNIISRRVDNHIAHQP